MKKRGRVADFGAGCGGISVLILAHRPDVRLWAVEINERAASIAAHNIAQNGFADRAEVVTADIRQIKVLVPASSFDLVVSNPPYFAEKSGKPPKSKDESLARIESSLPLSELCAAAAHILKWGGRFAAVFRPERLVDLLCNMRENKIEPKRLRLISQDIKTAPSAVLVEGMRGGKAGLKMIPTLLVKDANGLETEEIRRIYRKMN